jgi:DNA mismatch repair protein MutL
MTASPRIRRLPEDLVARIAAGEVVERPASALKELLENSLDAGARRVVITIEGAGRALLRISDDGCGMTREEAKLSLERHATSKISSLEDLERIQSFGFRGEAVPSIAAVSRFRLTTRSEGDDTGWDLQLDGGKLLSEAPAARERGTTIEVRDLFFNTPARFKFLKSDATERAQCLRVVEEAVFAFPTVEFEVRSETGAPVVFRAGRVPDGPAAVDTLRARLVEAWGPRWTSGVLPVAAESPHFAVWGALTDQGAHQGSARHQHLYINRRPVQNRRLARAVYEAYAGQLPSLRHPGFVLFVTVDPTTVDVNVHPSKREVKLTHESELFGFLLTSARGALTRTAQAPVAAFAKSNILATISDVASAGVAEPSLERATSAPVPEWPSFPTSPAAPRPSNPSVRESLDHLYRPLPGFAPAAEERPELVDLRDPSLIVLGQVRRTFLIAQTENGLLLADQHAAAEKVAYERLLANIKSAAPEIQMLLVPFTWEVSMALAATVQGGLETFRRMGFDIAPFGGSTFVVKGVPGVLGEKYDLHELLDEMVESASEPGERRGPGLEHRLAAAAACKASVKAGDPLDAAAGRRILAELARCESPFTCPHGRPTVLRLGYGELETRFRRK